MKNFFRLFILFAVCNIPILGQGELDTSFGGTGKFTIVNSPRGGITDFAFQADNKIVVVGGCRTIDVIDYPICMVRLTQAGATDSTFGGGGLNPSGQVRTSIPGSNPSQPLGSYSIVIQNDGKIVVLAIATVSGSQKTYLVRYHTDGSLDTTFGNQGFNELTAFQVYFPSDMQIQTDGKMVVIGQRYIARYLPDGTIDNTFGENGVFTLNINNFLSDGNAIQLRNDGKMVIGGHRNGAAFVGRLNANGTLDTNFGDNGYKFINGITNVAALSISADNKIALLGSSNLIYRLTADGSLDTTFDSDGSRSVFGPTTSYSSFDLAVTASGKISVVGNKYVCCGIDYLVARFNLDGSPDTTFDGDGLLEINIGNVDSPRSIVFDRDGRTVIAGLSAAGGPFNPYDDPRFSIARLVAPPTQNVSVSGRVFDSKGRSVINAFLVLSNGSEIIAQTRTNPFGYFRFNNVSAPSTYTITPRAKGLIFNEHNILVDDAISNLQVISQ